MLLRLTILAVLILAAAPLKAGDIKLNAEDRVEYHQKEQKLVAKGNAVASKDDMMISASTLIGYYNPSVKNKISRLEAHQNVRMESSRAKAFGDKLIYTIKTDTAELTGKPAKIKTADAEITADGKITYYQTAQKATAMNNVVAIDAKGNKIYADLMTAYFKPDSSGKLILDKVDIEKNVKITSEDTSVTALKGTYFAQTGKIELYDDVVISQNGNILKGSSAETDLNTGISKLLSGGTTGRVSGVFKEKKKKD